jgi:hypothetical protein
MIYQINRKSLVNKINDISQCYLVFDMDECIASIHGYSGLLEKLYEGLQTGLISEKSYNNYYNFMLNDLLENYKKYLYLRPGIIDVFTLIYFFKLILKQRNVELKCLIYTNNGLESLVQMVQTIINQIVGFPVIDNFVYRNSSCKIDIGPIGKMIKRLEHLQRCFSNEINSKNTLFFDNDNYSIFKGELGKNYIQVSPYYYYDRITVYNFYNNHIMYILTNRDYLGVFPIVSIFNDNLEFFIKDLLQGERVVNSRYKISNTNYDSFSLIIPSIFNFLGITPNGNEFLIDYLSNVYLH